MRPSWSRAGGALGLVLLGAALAGCGSSTSGTPLAADSAAQIVASAEDVAMAATSVHVSGSIVSRGAPVTFDLHLLVGRGGYGQLAESGIGFELVQAGHTVYVKGSTAFYSRIGGAAAARLLQGRWLKAPTTSPEFSSLASLTNLHQLIAQTLASHGALAKGSPTTIDGRRALSVSDVARHATLYVASTGPPYPIEVSQPGSSGGTITFDRWNQPVSVTTPANALDITQLRGAT